MNSSESDLDSAQGALNMALKNLDDHTTKLNALVGVRSQIAASEPSAALSNANLEANIDEETGDITFSSGIYFDFGSSQLKQEGMDSLNEFIPLYFNVLLTDKYRDYLSEVVIEGHADTNGDYMTNLDLQPKARIRRAQLPVVGQLSVSDRKSKGYAALHNDGERPLADLQTPYTMPMARSTWMRPAAWNSSSA